MAMRFQHWKDKFNFNDFKPGDYALNKTETVESEKQMSEITNASGVDFNALKPKNGSTAKLKTFTVVGKDLTEKQRKAGYYRQINKGDNIDGIYNGMSLNDRGDYPSTEVSILGLDGSEIIVKANTSLKNQLADVEVGSPMRLTYQGNVTLKKGAGKGKSVQNWSVNI